jgi:predicted metalloendopeptidase
MEKIPSNTLVLSPPDTPRKGMSGGESPHIPKLHTKTLPNHDFYSFVNKEWQKHVHVPAYRGGYGVSEEIEDDVENKLLSVISKQVRLHPSDSVSKLARSFLHTASQRNSVVDMQRILNTYECMSSALDIGHSIGAMNRIQSRSPISLYVNTDTYNSKKCNVVISETSLGLNNPWYYQPDTRHHISIKYVHLLRKLGKLTNIENLEFAATIESIISPYLMDGYEAADVDFYYNIHSYKELCLKYKHIPWENIFEGWGLVKEKYTTLEYNVYNPRYINILNDLFESMSLEYWKIWLRACTILSFLEYLPPPYDDLHFELFGRALNGKIEKLPQKYLTLKVLKTFAPQDLGRIFVDYDVPHDTKAVATKLVHRLKLATIKRLEAIDWMDASTRHIAIRKVEKMQFQVAHPTKWRSETTVVDINESRPLLNIINLNVGDTDRMLADINTGCVKSQEQWEDGVFEVNAFYYSEGNMMVVPAGILRSPFFDLKKSDAWNLGGIGVAIGHEITHGFDADGRFYDEYGNYKKWWTLHDEKIFEEKSQNIIKLFNNKPYMGGKVDGEFTLSENIADLGGVAIALEALNTMIRGKSEGIAKQMYKDFFISYAVSWRNKDRPKKAKESLKSDPHAPAQLRVNIIVAQFEEFYKAFDITPDMKGYVPPEKRVQLW